jgi:hypothetical protein
MRGFEWDMGPKGRSSDIARKNTGFAITCNVRESHKVLKERASGDAIVKF